MTSLIHLLSNLTDNESQLLIEYVQQRAYANLKEMIDEMRNNIYDFEDDEIFVIGDTNTDDAELFLGALNLSETQQQIIQAYQVHTKNIPIFTKNFEYITFHHRLYEH
ncbi:unnamed protein product [Toxocara canis]|uniref:Toxin-antitoxin system, toxin component n=1 Tax=Toxocara canis TaxID=6265 RepID=A0A183U9M1_TOXCA|nr:unnamed protein product [Toxocara canis]